MPRAPRSRIDAAVALQGGVASTQDGVYTCAAPGVPGTSRTREADEEGRRLPATPRSVVLDTNVVLDLFVFDDAWARPLRAPLEQGALIAWVDAATLRELELVLAYPSFALDAVAQRAVWVRYQSLARVASLDGGGRELPRCRDADDQKFLELADRSGAAWLVSKDRRLLSMAGGQRLPFDILSPRQATRRLAHADPEVTPRQ
ncbi:putative toxin-antitoxin system toxin component, PIN family [Corallococcus sp. M34]|nr:putative toxin-antitoxin system toxin component, PIN family [Citreicoccus inhibens]